VVDGGGNDEKKRSPLFLLNGDFETGADKKKPKDGDE